MAKDPSWKEIHESTSLSSLIFIVCAVICGHARQSRRSVQTSCFILLATNGKTRFTRPATTPPARLTSPASEEPQGRRPLSIASRSNGLFEPTTTMVSSPEFGRLGWCVGRWGWTRGLIFFSQRTCRKFYRLLCWVVVREGVRIPG